MVATERLFDELICRGSTYLDYITRTHKPVTDEVRDQIKGCIRVVADDAWAWYWGAEEDFWSLASGDFGPLRMPFEGMWVEGKMPSRCHADGTWFDIAAGTRSAVLMRENKPSGRAPTGTVATISATYMRSDAWKPPVAWPVGVLVHIDEAGACVGTETLGFGGLKGDTEGDALANALWGDIKSGFLAISLMNCRNTKVSVVTPEPERGGKKSRRPRMARLEYHTISLPNATGGKAARQGAAGEPIAFHKVRGHFAHYTADAPLFGKYVGTYWKPWHTRGSKAEGIIVADYEVGR